MGEGVVTRFAPSPTGHLHVGGARTALFNLALARGRGGRFLLRVEDTDRARSTEESTRGILDDLAWLGLDWDEGPESEGRGGDPRGVGPFHQARRREIYDRHIESLIAADHAYLAFETEAELDALRKAAQAEKRGFRYRRAADWDREDALARRATEAHVVRFRMPDVPVRVVDEVLGEVEFGEEHLDDFVLRKRDGFPTYHFASVVDDQLMGVTHVLRGQEHLNNTPRHVALQRALGFGTPVYAHLPLIFNLDGSKMSKRDKDKAARAALRAATKDEPSEDQRELASRYGDWLKDKKSQLPTETLANLAQRLHLDLPCIEVEDFRRAGYLPEVLCNYLALLGWSPGLKDDDGKDLERFGPDFLFEHFAMERVGRSNAKFDIEKLLSFNQDTIAELSDADFVALWSEWLERYPDARLDGRGADWRRRFAAMVRTRSRTLADPTAPGSAGAFALISDDAVVFDAKAVAKVLHKGEPSGLAQLAEIREVLASLDPFEPEPIEDAVRRFCEEREIGMGKVAQPLRVAMTGNTASPPLGDTLAILGSGSVRTRIDRCLQECEVAD